MMRGRLLFLVFVVLLFSLEGVVAWGVSAPYWNGRPLHIGQGEDIEVVLLLQNGQIGLFLSIGFGFICCFIIFILFSCSCLCSSLYPFAILL